jgi:hypothetical protein
MAAFYNSFMLRFPDIILSFYPKDFGMVAVASNNTGMTFVCNPLLLLLLLLL